MKTVLFWEAQLDVRGTAVAIYDYANWNEKLGNKSIIVTNKRDLNPVVYYKFKDRFGDNIKVVNSFNDVNKIKSDYFYVLKYGHNDGILLNDRKNLVHVVFPSRNPHGDVYAYISKWLSEYSSNGELPYVPHMIDLPKVDSNYREWFGYKKSDIVIGWYGGDNFELEFVKQAIGNVLEKRNDLQFVFMNCKPFMIHPNIKFIETSVGLNEKVAFINTCDVMIHARTRGETFGLAIGEFNTLGKRVITFADSPERNHIVTLGDAGIYYRDYDSIYNILLNLDKKQLEGDWNRYQDYEPEKVMKQFNKVFLN